MTKTSRGSPRSSWVIDNDEDIKRITEIFSTIPAFYVADGHHRTAAAALVGEEKRRQNPNHRGDEEYNYFMAVVFPESHLKIIDYNRVVKDLNGLTPWQWYSPRATSRSSTTTAW